MPAKKKPAQTKATTKLSELTPIGDVIKMKKLPAKKITKKVKKKAAPKKPAKPAFTRKMFEQHFYSLSQRKRK